MATLRALEATPFGGVLLGNIWPAYLFALPLGARLWALGQTWTAWPAGPATGASTAAAWHAQSRQLQELVTIVFLGVVVGLFVVRRRRVAGQRSTFLPGLVALLGTFALNAVAYLPIQDTASSGALLLSSGLVMLGTLFSVWSLAALGRCFGILPEVRGLVLDGPYRLVRHPVYLGELISAFGLALARPHLLVVVVVAGFVALQYWRTRYEEQALSAAFPDAYPAYRGRVPRLVPGLRA